MSDVGNEIPKTCFIVSPIGSKLDPVGTPGRLRYEEAIQMWEEVFKPACAEFGLEPIRADKIADTGEIPEQIFRYLRDADVVIADLSGGNANVMYELGLRHTRDKITIQVGEYERLPFDVTTIKTVQFKRSEGGLIEARNSLMETLRSALEGKGTPVSATRVWLDSPQADGSDLEEAVRKSSSPDEEGTTDEPGFIDVLAEGEAAITGLEGPMTEYGAQIALIGNAMESATDEITQSDANQKGFAGRVLVSRKLAETLAEPAAALDALADDIFLSVQTVDQMMQYLIERFREDEQERAQAGEFIDSVLTMVDGAESAEDSSRGFLAGIQGLPKLSRELGPVSKLISRSLNRYLQTTEIISSWREGLEELRAKD